MQIGNVDPMLVIAICFMLGGLCLIGISEIATKKQIARFFDKTRDFLKRAGIVRLLNKIRGLVKRIDKDTLVIIGCFMLVSCVGLGSFVMYKVGEAKHARYVDYLEGLVVEVEMLIEQGDFVSARVTATQIDDDTDWSSESEEEWDNVRERLLEIIDKEEAEHETQLEK